FLTGRPSAYVAHDELEPGAATLQRFQPFVPLLYAGFNIVGKQIKDDVVGPKPLEWVARHVCLRRFVNGRGAVYFTAGNCGVARARATLARDTAALGDLDAAHRTNWPTSCVDWWNENGRPAIERPGGV